MKEKQEVCSRYDGNNYSRRFAKKDHQFHGSRIEHAVLPNIFSDQLKQYYADEHRYQEYHGHRNELQHADKKCFTYRLPA